MKTLFIAKNESHRLELMSQFRGMPGVDVISMRDSWSRYHGRRWDLIIYNGRHVYDCDDGQLVLERLRCCLLLNGRMVSYD